MKTSTRRLIASMEEGELIEARRDLERIGGMNTAVNSTRDEYLAAIDEALKRRRAEVLA